jgi:putative colanic acid biosynthesis acetyltransferase WcaF
MTTINTNTRTGASFSLTNRILRLVWGIVYQLFFRFSPKPFHVWRSFVLKLFGAKIGKGVHVYGGVKIWAPWNIEIGDFSGIADGVKLYSQDKISIGKNTVISQGSHICTGTHDYNDNGFKLITKPISIGNDVWIAAEVFVHPGLIIEDGCVISARSVVTNNMPAWNICSGFPCMPIKLRTKIN